METKEKEDVDHPRVYKVIGAPGTGKTTKVVGNPELQLKGLFFEAMEHYALDEQMIVTYTNAGVDEAADRLERMLDEPRSRIDKRVTTIHSQCFQILGLKREDVVDHWKKKNFCDTYDLDFGWDDEEGDMMASEQDEGNALFQMHGWLKSNRKELEEWEDYPGEFPSNRDPLELMRRWEAWKDDRGLLQFHDMIERVVDLGREQVENLGLGPLFPDEGMSHMELFEEARNDDRLDKDLMSKMRGKGAFIDTKVLYVDEVQDLTPLQWCWYLLQKLVCERVYLGGDDDQTIYGWAGANPEFMLDEEGDFEVLETTYRIPKGIWEVCDDVIRQVDKRQDKEVEPNGEGGEVVKMHTPKASRVLEHAQEGSVYILFRARYMIDEFTEELHDAGIPYSNESTFDTWEDDIVAIRDALAKFHKGEGKIKGNNLEVLIDYAEDEMLSNESLSGKERSMGQLGGIEVERANDFFKYGDYNDSGLMKPRQYLNAAEEVNYYQQQAIMGNLKEGNEDMKPHRVRIGTIHSSKGREAETIILATDSTQQIVENMHDDLRDKPDKTISDAERRLMYVGMTRASEKLIIAQGLVDNTYALNIEDLLNEDPEDSDWRETKKLGEY